MHITLSPVRMDEILTASLAGDVLTINGQPYDFTKLHEGDLLPAEAINSKWIIGAVTRINGELQLMLRLPHGPDPTQSVAFPDPITVTDGEVELPT